MMHARRFLRPLSVLSLFALGLSAQHLAESAQKPSSTDIRSVIEGTWQLEEWHVNGEVLKPPQADGRWSNRDGVVLFLLHRKNGETASSTVGYGVYEMDESTWSYRYNRMETSSGPVSGPAKVAVTEPPPAMRSFKIAGQGDKIILTGAGGDRREYEGPYFTLFQNDKIVRKWRRVG